MSLILTECISKQYFNETYKNGKKNKFCRSCVLDWNYFEKMKAWSKYLIKSWLTHMSSKLQQSNRLWSFPDEKNQCLKNVYN